MRSRRRRSFVVVVCGVAVASAPCTTPLAAQQGSVSSQCAAALFVARDACQKALDLYSFMAPQLGVSITGGNAVIGGAGTLGGPGHFAIGVRANVIQGQLPRADGVQLDLTQPRSSNFAPREKLGGLPTADAAIGIFRGVNVGVTNVGGIDALVSAFYVPDVGLEQVRVSTSGNALQLGYGVRVGVLQETSLVPGVSISYLRRDLPRVDIHASIGTADSVSVTGLKEKTSAWRLAASKGISLLGVTAGVGRDHYDSRADASAFVAPRSIGGIINVGFTGSVAQPSQELTRTNVFAGASLRLALVRLAAEVGRVSGGSIAAPFNSFGNRRADDTYTYGSFGLRVGI